MGVIDKKIMDKGKSRMQYDPIKAAINLAAQLIVYEGFSFEEVADIAVVHKNQEEVEIEVDRLRTKQQQDTTRRHFKFSTRECTVRKAGGFQV